MWPVCRRRTTARCHRPTTSPGWPYCGWPQWIEGGDGQRHPIARRVASLCGLIWMARRWRRLRIDQALGQRVHLVVEHRLALRPVGGPGASALSRLMASPDGLGPQVDDSRRIGPAPPPSPHQGGFRAAYANHGHLARLVAAHSDARSAGSSPSRSSKLRPGCASRAGSGRVYFSLTPTGFFDLSVVAAAGSGGEVEAAQAIAHAVEASDHRAVIIDDASADIGRLAAAASWLRQTRPGRPLDQLSALGKQRKPACAR